jgi:hypothetical protein
MLRVNICDCKKNTQPKKNLHPSSAVSNLDCRNRDNKFEIVKHEYRNPKQIQNSKVQNSKICFVIYKNML